MKMVYLLPLFLILQPALLVADSLWGKGEVPRLTDPASVPQTLEALWSGYEAAYDQHNPLEVEILKTWEEDGIRLHVVRFTVGTFQGKKAKLAGFYGYPVNGNALPAVVQTNGGGQRGSLFGVKKWAAAGYAVFNPNNGAQPWGAEAKGLPNTDWGALRPGIPGDKRNGKGMLAPGPFTIDAVDSPRNHQWFPRVIGARRAISFLQSRPEVDGSRIGIRGHSTGGVMTVFESIDSRVKAAVPSVGGCGFWFEEMPYVIGNTRGNGGASPEQLALFQQTASMEAHWRAMHAPVFFLGASNDFNSPTDNVWKALSVLPAGVTANWALAPHYNHSFNPEVGISDILWFEDHLKGGFEFPGMPSARMELEAADGVPRLRVRPDASYGLAVSRVQVYYSYERNPMARFWTAAETRLEGGEWVAECPVFDPEEPLFAFAAVTYAVDHEVRGGPSPFRVPELMVASAFVTVLPQDLKAGGIRATAEFSRMIEDFRGELRDWTGDLGKPRGWTISTRKIADPRWVGPEGAELVLEAHSPVAGRWLGFYASHRFRGANSGALHFYSFVPLEKKGWNTVRLQPEDFQNVYGEKLTDWGVVSGIRIGDAEAMANDKRRFLPRAGDQAVPAIPSEVSSWDSSYYQSTDDAYAKDNIEHATVTGARNRFRDLRWEGGIPRTHFKPWRE